MTELNRQIPLKSGAVVVLVLYWLLVFTGTHLSKAPQVIETSSDKVLHFSAYTGLAFLLSLNVWLHRGTFGWAQRLAVVGLGSAYGVIDELTQIPVGRDCEFLDWVADTAGSAAGMAIFLAALWLWQRIARNERVAGTDSVVGTDNGAGTDDGANQ